VTDGSVDWAALIEQAKGQRQPPRRAIRHEGGLPTASKPQKFLCDDSGLYAVKFSQNQHGDGKAIFTEQVVGLAGKLLGAPVGPVELVDVAPALADALRADPSLGFDPQPGPHHGSRWVGTNVSDRLGLETQYLPTNRERFGALEVLYCWIPCTGDHQWIYDNEPPNHVYSVDHTTFFPSGSDWTVAGLAAEAANVSLDAQLATLGLDANDRRIAVEKLQAVTETQIAAVVAQPPDDWGVSADERRAVASYLWTRTTPVAAVCS
jgi:hypothetical protein